MTALHARAPAKINLCLLVGPVRPQDGRHELVSVMDTVSLADELVLQPADGDADEVVCPGVEGPNLVASAIAAFRGRTGWDGPPVRIGVEKRIPVAGGMAGGSADAAAALRLLAAHAATGDDALLEAIAATLGADVPSQVRGGRVLATGAGERLEPAAPGGPYGVLVLPGRRPRCRPRPSTPRPTAARCGPARSSRARARRCAARTSSRAAWRTTCRPRRGRCAPRSTARWPTPRRPAADELLVSGSGPTVLGLFAGEDGAGARAGGRGGAGRSPPRRDRRRAGARRLGRGRRRAGASHCRGRAMSNETVIYVVAAGCGALALLAWLGLFVVPAWKSYSHWWERIAATFLTLYVLAALLVIGGLGGALVAYYWDDFG